MDKFRRNSKVDIDNFFTSIDHGNLYMVKSFISKGLNVNYQGSNGWSPLMTASVGGHDSIVKCLLEAGADVNLCRDGDSSSVLLTCIELTKTSEEQCLKCSNIMISAGAKVNKADILGKTPLMAAAELDMAKVVLLLLANRANINLTDNEEKSALRWAIEKNSLNALKSLLEGPAVPRLGRDICHYSVNFAVELKNRYFAALIQKHITSTITTKDWSGIPDDEIDAILTSRVDVAVRDCKSVVESHLFSWDMPHLIPLFRNHRIPETALRHMTDADFETIGVESSYRSRLTQEVDMLFFKHKRAKTARGTAMPGVTFPEVLAVIENMKDHIVFTYAAFGHRMKDKIITNPKQLTSKVSFYTIGDLGDYCRDCTRNLNRLRDSVVALNNIIVDVNEDEDKSKLLPGNTYSYRNLSIVLTAAAVVAVIVYLNKK